MGTGTFTNSNSGGTARGFGSRSAAYLRERRIPAKQYSDSKPLGGCFVSVWATHPFLPLRLVVHLSYERSWSVAEAA
jgi:hypothetical protein